VLAVWARESPANDAGVDAEGTGFRGMAPAWNVASQAVVDKAVVRVATAGGTIMNPLQTAFWGGL
jgi:uncharacterized glyoxalase superfamily protein PhnB